MPLLRRGSQWVHALGRGVCLRAQTPSRGRTGWGSHPRRGGGDRGQFGRCRRRQRRPSTGAVHHRTHPPCTGGVDAHSLCPCGPHAAGVRLYRSPCHRHRGRRPHRGQRHRRSVRRCRARRAAAGFGRQEQRGAYGSCRIQLLPAQDRADDAAAHLRTGVEELPSAESRNRLRKLSDAGADRLRTVPRPPGGGRHQLVRLWRVQRALRGARIPPRATPNLVGAAGTQGRLHDPPVGAHVRRAGKKRATARGNAR